VRAAAKLVIESGSGVVRSEMHQQYSPAPRPATLLHRGGMLARQQDIPLLLGVWNARFAILSRANSKSGCR